MDGLGKSQSIAGCITRYILAIIAEMQEITWHVIDHKIWYDLLDQVQVNIRGFK